MTESQERPLSWKKGDVTWRKPKRPETPEHAPACILMPDGRPVALDHPDAVEQPGGEHDDGERVQGSGSLEEPGGGEAVRPSPPGARGSR